MSYHTGDSVYRGDVFSVFLSALSRRPCDKSFPLPLRVSPSPPYPGWILPPFRSAQFKARGQREREIEKERDLEDINYMTWRKREGKAHAPAREKSISSCYPCQILWRTKALEMPPFVFFYIFLLLSKMSGDLCVYFGWDILKQLFAPSNGV